MALNETEYTQGYFPCPGARRDVARVRAVLGELDAAVEHVCNGRGVGKRFPDSAEIRLRVNQIALAAGDAARQGGLDGEAASAAARRAGLAAVLAHAAGAGSGGAAEAAVELGRITGREVRIVDIERFDAPYGEFDRRGGELVLCLPLFRSGKHGEGAAHGSV